GDLVTSALIGIGVGMATTALAMYIPGHRSLGREVAEERAQIAGVRVPAWRRWRLDLAFLAAAAIAEVIAFRSGAFDAETTSVSAGESVSLPSHLLLAPLAAWFGGVLLSARAVPAITSRIPIPAPPQFGRLVPGILGRSLKR